MVGGGGASERPGGPAGRLGQPKCRPAVRPADNAVEPNRRNLTGRAEPPVHSVQPFGPDPPDPPFFVSKIMNLSVFFDFKLKKCFRLHGVLYGAEWDERFPGFPGNWQTTDNL